MALHCRFLEDVEVLRIMKKEELDWQSKPVGDAARNQRIAQFQREKAAKQALAQLRERKKLALKRGLEDTEEIDRECILALILCCAINAASQLRMVQQELEMLESVEKMKATGTFQKRWDEEHKLPPNPRRPVTILPTPSAQRMALHERVFQPGYSLPTMTSEEALRLELSQGNAIAKSGPKHESDEEDSDRDQDNDDKLKKARDWDDWKDENPRGSGNTIGQG
eukprot:TRINITY_DN2325_c0_g1_i3.p1 TRINITY_DN2325_c0_g1~~TRINITY_DN2325_c0_g1_i3.p1  ORF type:complete len:224 (+),score=59.72 TRINITY_DN2325_c0_g1_i3:375-1046(+)